MSLLTEAAKLFGFVGFVCAIQFITWLITQRASNKQTEIIANMIQENQKNLTAQSERQIETVVKQYDKMFDLQKTIHQNNYDQLKEILELQRIQIQTLSRLEVKIDSM